MQAIETKYLSPTNFRGARIKAICERGSITVDYDHSKNSEGAHIAAADALVAKFAAEDLKQYGESGKPNPWLRPRVVGGLPGAGYVHVFSDWNQAVVIKFALQEDCDRFSDYVKTCKASDSSPSAMKSALVALALKRASM